MVKGLLSVLSIISFLSLSFYSCSSNEKHISSIEDKKDTLIVLENDVIQLKISVFGGAIIDFHDKKNGINPFTWKLNETQMPENNKNGAIFQGHFICIGRWGSPSEGEKKLGMPHNGEPANNWWNIKNQKDGKFVEMSCEAPLDGLTLNRKVTVSQNMSCFKVTETITNDLSIGRMNTVVQHATLGLPFLDKSLIINSNASFGFNQTIAKKELEKYRTRWPNVYADTLLKTIDVSKSLWDSEYVASYVFSDSIAWVTAVNFDQKQLIGYAWKTNEYPWLNIWNGINDGKLWAKGLEFGTTGLGDTFSFEDRCSISFQKVSSTEFIDAKSSVSKSYYCFELQVPEGFQKTLRVSFQSGKVSIILLTNSGVKEVQLSL